MYIHEIYSNKTIVEMHAEQGSCDGSIGFELTLHDLTHDGFSSQASRVVEANLQIAQSQREKKNKPEKGSYILHCFQVNLLERDHYLLEIWSYLGFHSSSTKSHYHI